MMTFRKTFKILFMVVALLLFVSTAFAATRAAQFDFLLSGLVDPLTGSPLTSGTVEFYASGTTTPKNVWTEPEKTNAYTTRTLAAGGVYQLYGEGVYRVVVKRSNGTTIWTWDNIKLEYPSSTVLTITGNTNQTTDHDIILADTDGGNITYALLAAASWTHPVTVKNIGTGSAIIDANGSETIDGSATYIISANNQAITFFSNSSNIYKANDIADNLVGLTASTLELNQLDEVSVGGVASGDIATTDGTQTFTNKTMTGGTITGATITGGSIGTYIKGDDTANLEMRVLLLVVTKANDGSVSAYIQSTWNGDAVSTVFSITKNTVGTYFGFGPDGDVFYLYGNCFSDNVVAVAASNLIKNGDLTGLGVRAVGSGSGIVLSFFSGDADTDISAMSTNAEIFIAITYLTSP